MTYEITLTGSNGKSRVFQVEVARGKDGQQLCKVDGQDITGIDARFNEREVLSLVIGNQSYEIRRDASATQARIVVGDESFAYEVRDPRSLGARRAKAASHDGPKKIKAPMPGKVVRILAREGTQVEAGQGVIVIEAMKMQNELKSPKSGIVRKILAGEGAAVTAGQALAEIE